MGVYELYSEFEKNIRRSKDISCEENTSPLTFKAKRKLHKFTLYSEFRFPLRRGVVSSGFILRRFFDISYLDRQTKQIKEKKADYVLITLPHDIERTPFKEIRESAEVNKKIALIFLNEEEKTGEIFNKTDSLAIEKFKTFLEQKKSFKIKSTNLEIKPNQEVLDEITKLQKQLFNINKKIENKLLHPDVRKKQFIYTVGSVILAAISSLILIDLSGLLRMIFTSGFTSSTGLTIFIDYMMILIFFGIFGWLKDKYEITSYDIYGKVKGKNKIEIYENFKFIKDETYRLIEDIVKLNIKVQIKFCGLLGGIWNKFKFMRDLGRKPTEEEKQVYINNNINVIKDIIFKNKDSEIFLSVNFHNEQCTISILQNLITYEDSFNLEEIGKKFFKEYKRRG